MDPSYRPFLWTLPIDPSYRPFLWTLPIDPSYRPFIETLPIDPMDAPDPAPPTWYVECEYPWYERNTLAGLYNGKYLR